MATAARLRCGRAGETNAGGDGDDGGGGVCRA